MKLDGFEILEELGHGGMATVYRARQVSLDREVAIKVFEPRFEPTPEDLEKFRNEARVAARLKHRGLVQVYDAVFSGDLYCFVMELVRGYTVSDWGARKGTLDEKTILDVADCVADALDYAWKQQSVIHCDIKPDNLMVDADGTVKILDLGLAKTAQAIRQKELADQVYGTPQYISPEQAIGQTDLDCRTDIYALGATLYQLATGQTLFPGHSDAEAMDMQVRSKAPNPRALNPKLSICFCALLEKMLAKDRDRRQKDWFEVRRDIEAARLGIPLPSGNPLAGASTIESGPSPAYTKDTLHLHASVHAPVSHIGKNTPAAAAPKAPKTQGRRRFVVRSRPSSNAASAPSSAAAAVPPRPSSKAPLMAIVVVVLAAVVIGIAASSQAKERRRREAAASALSAARAAVAAIPETSESEGDFARAEQLFAAAARYSQNAAIVEQDLAALRDRKAAAAKRLADRSIDELIDGARLLAENGNIDRAVARLREYEGPGADTSKTRREAEIDALLRRQREAEEAARLREEQAERTRQAAAERQAAEARQTSTVNQILDMLESSGIGAANDLAAEKASSDPALFAPGSACADLRSLLDDALAAQTAFDKSFPLDAVVTLKLRNGTEVRGRITRFVRASDELHVAMRVNGTDIDRTIRLQELAPTEITSRFGNGTAPGVRFARMRLFVRYDLPRPALFIEEQCRGFSPRVRALATAPVRNAAARP